jgi:hypothetical protein
LLEQALASADAPLVMERLHRLVGSLAFVVGLTWSGMGSN